MAGERGPPDAGWSELECAALVGEDQPLCPDLPELDLSELDVNDLDDNGFLGGLKWYNDQSEIISHQYPTETSNIFETLMQKIHHVSRQRPRAENVFIRQVGPTPR